MNPVACNLSRINQGIEAAASEYGRNAADIHLVAVSKQQPDDRVNAALESGQRLFGENRVQEAIERWSTRRADYPDLQLHLIGPLQTNKVRDAVALFDVIETIDRPGLADTLKTEMEKQGKSLSCFIQVNTGEEPQKAGIAPTEFRALLDYCHKIGLEISGLMCIPPSADPPALHFSLLRNMAREAGLKNLSMGMSTDFEKAIPLGATYVRVGTAIFGDRSAIR